MFFVEVAKAKRTCSQCNGSVEKNKACLVFGRKDERLSRRNLCQKCLTECHGTIVLHNSGISILKEQQDG